jgi:hypothetical protein
MAVQLFAIINVKNSLPGTHQSKIAAAKEPQKNNAKEYTVNRSLATNQPLADSVLLATGCSSRSRRSGPDQF